MPQLEGALKTKWTKHARKQGFLVKPLSPHQIPGLPDLYVVDGAINGIMFTHLRARGYWVEAKRANPGPVAFKVGRKDGPTTAQQKFVLQMNAVGIPCYWLILSDDKWMLTPVTTTEVSRRQFAVSGKAYGKPISMLMEETKGREEVIEATRVRLQEVEAQIVTKAKA